VREESRRASPDFTSLVSVTAVTDSDAIDVAGTTIGRENKPRLVRALGYEIEIELDSLMLFVVNEDRPGIIGRLGSILGEARINIANMAVSRNRRSAKALMVLTLDSPIPDELLGRLSAEPGFVEARSIVLERE
jgi:D-3-phosphoglycerate dehydrogenase